MNKFEKANPFLFLASMIFLISLASCGRKKPITNASSKTIGGEAVAVHFRAIPESRPIQIKDYLKLQSNNLKSQPKSERSRKVSTDSVWKISGQLGMKANILKSENLILEEGLIFPKDKLATLTTKIKTFSKKRSATFLELKQFTIWENWTPVPNIGPSNLGDAPVAVQLGDKNYWMFGLYEKDENQKAGAFQSKKATLDGFDIDLKTTTFKNQFDALGGLMPSKGGYHAWQSKDMVNWVHHGPITETFSRWMTTAEYVDGKFYFYYDFPNDQDPHLYIDEDLADGLPGKNMGMAFNDPSDGSDCAVIRDLEGNFHLILEDWSPINASTHAWDSPLAMHAVSADGISGFKILNPPVDERTKPTGKFREYAHPHWNAEAPDRFPGKTVKVDVPQHKMKVGDTRAFATYEIHEPEQNAYGDWAAISIGGQYYLFSDFDPAGSHGKEDMSIAWFTSNDINKPFTFLGNIGKGHPDPDIMFAEDKFHLVTQLETDFVSPGPWVETVMARVGVDSNNNGNIDTWSTWQKIKETYDYVDGFSKQISKTPAKLDLSDLPEGYGFQIELKLEDSTENDSKPMIEALELFFE